MDEIKITAFSGNSGRGIHQSLGSNFTAFLFFLGGRIEAEGQRSQIYSNFIIALLMLENSLFSNAGIRKHVLVRAIR